MFDRIRQAISARLSPASGATSPEDVETVKQAFDEFEGKLLAALESKAANAAEKVEEGAAEVVSKLDSSISFPRRFGARQALADLPDTGTFSSLASELPTSVLSHYRRLAARLPMAMPAEVTAPSAGPVAAPAPAPPPDTSALNAETVQSVQFENREVADYAPTLVATPPDQMIGQAAGLAAQASAAYFDGMTKIVMASQSIMLKKMAQDVASGNEIGAAEDGLIIAETELLLAGAMAVAAAGGAMEAASAGFGIKQINDSVNARVSRAAALSAR